MAHSVRRRGGSPQIVLARKIIDLHGRRVVPGFYDSHVHLLGSGLGLARVALKDAANEAEFGKRLASELTLVATLEGSPVGFASLKGADHIDMLYVHPGAVGQGVASLLCDALEKLAGGRCAKNLTVDASDNAVEFFAKRGYEPKQRNTVSVSGEWLANTTMQKTLGEGAKPGVPT